MRELGKVGTVEERGKIEGEGGGMGGQGGEGRRRVGVKRDGRAKLPEA